jgi:hypothetical protein
MTTAIIMLALLTAMEGRQFPSGSAELVAGSQVDLLGDGLEPMDAFQDDEATAAELHAAMFGDWTMEA